MVFVNRSKKGLKGLKLATDLFQFVFFVHITLSVIFDQIALADIRYQQNSQKKHVNSQEIFSWVGTFREIVVGN